MKVELQVLRDMKAFSRPQVLDVSPIIERCASGTMGDYAYTWQLFPGWAGDAAADIRVRLDAIHPVRTGWYSVESSLYVDAISMGTRPGVFYGEPSDIPSGYVQFLGLAAPEHPLYGQTYTATFRTVER